MTAVTNGRTNIKWEPILERAADIVYGYDTGVTLRQLYYRLVSEQLIPNTRSAYQYLSKSSAEGRRNGDFPDLIDQTSSVQTPAHEASAKAAFEKSVRRFRLDRTAGQEYNIILGVEKHGLSTQLWSWFSGLGVSVVALGGYPSQTLCDEITGDIEADGREAILIYAGDHDPSGWDIQRDLEDRVCYFDDVIRVALDPDLIAQHQLPENPGKPTDSRAAAFCHRFGSLVQVEVDALDPETLRDLYQNAIDQYWDTDAYTQVLGEEREQRASLLAALNLYETDEDEQQ